MWIEQNLGLDMLELIQNFDDYDRPRLAAQMYDRINQLVPRQFEGEDTRLEFIRLFNAVCFTCPAISGTVNEAGDLPGSGDDGELYYIDAVDPIDSTIVVWDGAWTPTYRIISLEQSGLNFTEVNFTILSGWSISVDGGTTWYDTTAAEVINVPAPMVVRVRNDANGCIYVGQSIPLQYDFYYSDSIDASSFPITFDLGSYGSTFAGTPADLSDYLQSNVTPESGAALAANSITLWITIPKGDIPPADWTADGTPINLGLFRQGYKTFGCLQSSFTVTDASTWVLYTLTESESTLVGEPSSFLPYDDGGLPAILNTLVTNMYGATASGTLSVIGNDVVITILDTVLIVGGAVSSTEDFVGFQNDTISQIACP